MALVHCDVGPDQCFQPILFIAIAFIWTVLPTKCLYTPESVKIQVHGSMWVLLRRSPKTEKLQLDAAELELGTTISKLPLSNHSVAVLYKFVVEYVWNGKVAQTIIKKTKI